MDDTGIRKVIENALSQSPYACTTLTQLSGGTANFVYRGVLAQPLQDGTKTIIVKHTEDYIASNKDFKLSAERCLVEESALRILDGLSSSSMISEEPEGQKGQICVKTPRLFSFDASSNTQLMEDLPDALDLKSFMTSTAGSKCISREWSSSVGRAVAVWLQSFHTWASQSSQEEVAVQFAKNLVMRDLKFSINYANLVNTIANFPHLLEGSRPLFEKVRDMAAGEVGKTEGFEFGPIHGDFWSGNVLIPKTAIERPSHTTQILITDWEMAQCGNRALDLGQMMAELYMLKHFKNIDAGLWVIEGFAEAYHGMTEELAFRAIIHVGVHLIIWGSTIPGWGTTEQVHDVVCVGRDLITKAWEQDRAWFDGQVWRCLFRAQN